MLPNFPTIDTKQKINGHLIHIYLFNQLHIYYYVTKYLHVILILFHFYPDILATYICIIFDDPTKLLTILTYSIKINNVVIFKLQITDENATVH